MVVVRDEREGEPGLLCAVGLLDQRGGSVLLTRLKPTSIPRALYVASPEMKKALDGGGGVGI
jgi:hypothetical protein